MDPVLGGRIGGILARVALIHICDLDRLAGLGLHAFGEFGDLGSILLIRRLIERRGITDLFDLIVTSAEEGVKKPQARIYEITLERLDVIAAEAVFIDDTDENVMAARDLGMQSILFHSTEQTIAELEALLAQRGVVRT